MHEPDRIAAAPRNGEQRRAIAFGLDPDERVAVTNTFILKAELGKSEADHGHAH